MFQTAWISREEYGDRGLIGAQQLLGLSTELTSAISDAKNVYSKATSSSRSLALSFLSHVRTVMAHEGEDAMDVDTETPVAPTLESHVMEALKYAFLSASSSPSLQTP